MKTVMDWLANVRPRLRAAASEAHPARLAAKLVFLGLILGCIVTVSLAVLSPRLMAAPRSQKTAAPSVSSKPLSDAQIARMSPTDLTKYVFENHGCNTCHTLSADWQLSFTDRGKQLSKGFEGCASLLTSMNVIGQVQPSERTADEKVKAARFEQFGCTTCHQIVPGQMALTSYGKKIKSLHVPGCTTSLCCATPRK
jgi:cytochrome c551/c552